MGVDFARPADYVRLRQKQGSIRLLEIKKPSIEMEGFYDCLPYEKIDMFYGL